MAISSTTLSRRRSRASLLSATTTLPPASWATAVPPALSRSLSLIEPKAMQAIASPAPQKSTSRGTGPGCFPCHATQRTASTAAMTAITARRKRKIRRFELRRARSCCAKKSKLPLRVVALLERDLRRPSLVRGLGRLQELRGAEAERGGEEVRREGLP